MLLTDFIIMIIGVLVLYAAQNIKNNPMKWILRIVGIIILLYPALTLLWSNVIAPKYFENERPQQNYAPNILNNIERGVAIDSLDIGSPVECNWKEYGTYYPGTIASINKQNGTIHVKYNDGDEEDTVISQCRPINNTQ